MTKVEVRPLEGFEEDYARYVARKAKIEEEVKAEYEKILAERTAKLDQLIALTSEPTDVEYEDEVDDEPETEEGLEQDDNTDFEE